MPIVMLAQWSSLNDILMIKLIFSFATFPLLFVIAFCWGEDIGSSGQWFPAAENAKVKAGKQTFISGKGFYVQLILSLSLSCFQWKKFAFADAVKKSCNGHPEKESKKTLTLNWRFRFHQIYTFSISAKLDAQHQQQQQQQQQHQQQQHQQR